MGLDAIFNNPVMEVNEIGINEALQGVDVEVVVNNNLNNDAPLLLAPQQ